MRRDSTLAFTEMGNMVVDVTSDSEEVADILYQFYNPVSSQSESFKDRMNKVFSTANRYGQTPSLRDFIAPRGIQFGKWNYVAYDGMCNT